MDKDKINSTLLSLSIIGLSEATWYFWTARSAEKEAYSPFLGGLTGLLIFSILALFIHIPVEIVLKKKGKRQHMSRTERRQRILFIALILSATAMIMNAIGFFSSLSS